MSRPKKTRLDQLQGEKNKSTLATRMLAATITLRELKDGDRKLIKLTAQSGQAITLPFATGKGSCYRIFLEKSITSNTDTIAVQAGNNVGTGAQDVFLGYAGYVGGSTQQPVCAATSTITHYHHERKHPGRFSLARMHRVGRC